MDRQFAYPRWRGMIPVLGLTALCLLWLAIPPASPHLPAESAQPATLAEPFLSVTARLDPPVLKHSQPELALPAPAMLTLPTHPRRMALAAVDYPLSGPGFALPTGGSELLLSVPNLDDPPAAAKRGELVEQGPQIAITPNKAAPADRKAKELEAPLELNTDGAKLLEPAAERPARSSRVLEFGKSASTSSAKVIEFGKSASTSSAKVLEFSPAAVEEKPSAPAVRESLPPVDPKLNQLPPETTLSEPIELESQPQTRLELQRPLLSSDESPRSRPRFERTPPPPPLVADAPAEPEPTRPEATEHARHGFELIGRNAYSGARAELLTALKLVAQKLDAGARGAQHEQTLNAALTAILESDDFAPRQGAPLDAATIARGHRTPVLRNVRGLNAPAALTRYLTYAQEQLAVAAGHDSVGAIALYGLGKLHDTPAAAVKAREAKALMYYQASLAVMPRNSVAANDVGVLLARLGRYSEAREALEYSLSIRSQPTAWHNLAVVYQSLGFTDRAQRAERLAQSSPTKPAPAITAMRPR